MSYIVEQNKPLFLTKITDIGRKAIAQGNFNFKYWAIGDSEINYDLINLIPEGLGNPSILKPKDNNPLFNSYITEDDCTQLQPISDGMLKVAKCCVRNAATERGFFEGTGVTTPILKNNAAYVKYSGTVQLSDLDGGITLNLNTVAFNDGDLLLLKIANSATGVLNATETEKPVLYLWFKIIKQGISTIVELDRRLPDFSFMQPDVAVNFYIFEGDESIDNFYATGQTNIVWLEEKLEFRPECDTTDVNVLNFNGVWNEDFAGILDNLQDYTKHGSFDYHTTKHYLGYDDICATGETVSVDCQDKLNFITDQYKKGIGIIHFSNNSTLNEYGEYFYIDNLNSLQLKLKLPTLMWHRRDFGGSGLGDKLGMQFVSSGQEKTLKNTDIKYFDLVEEFTLIGDRTPIAVGKIFHNLKIVVIDDEELLAAMSYKSNRNYTLPKLNGKMTFPTGGANNGVIPPNKTAYVTYALESHNGVKYTLPCQNYTKVTNNTDIYRDIEVSIEDTGLLPYMRQYNEMGYDGYGFYAHKFKLLIQIVDNDTDRPVSDAWKSLDLTNVKITGIAGYPINPTLLENQNPSNIGFTISKGFLDANSTTYSLQFLGIPASGCDEVLHFGDERFFFGNLETQIGACIYKNILSVKIQEQLFSKSTNTSWKDDEQPIVSEIGIFNDKQELVMVSKLSKPIKLIENSISELEISLDF